MASSSHGTTPRSTCSATACTTAPAFSRGSAATRPTAARRSSATREHLDRLGDVGRALLPAARARRDEIREATHELIRRNELRSCYIRPLAFRGYGEMGLYAQSAPVDVMVAVWPWGAYLGEESKREGIRAKVSSWRRISPAGLIPHAKASGQYLNSILAKTETRQGRLRRGDPARRGRATSARARARTSSSSATATIVDARPHGVDPRRDLAQVGDPDRHATSATRWSSATWPARSSTWPTRSSSCGTAAELVPVREVDDHEIGPPGEVTTRDPGQVRGRPARTRSGVPRMAGLRRGSE